MLKCISSQQGELSQEQWPSEKNLWILSHIERAGKETSGDQYKQSISSLAASELILCWTRNVVPFAIGHPGQMGFMVLTLGGTLSRFLHNYSALFQLISLRLTWCLWLEAAPGNSYTEVAKSGPAGGIRLQFDLDLGSDGWQQSDVKNIVFKWCKRCLGYWYKQLEVCTGCIPDCCGQKQNLWSELTMALYCVWRLEGVLCAS